MDLETRLTKLERSNRRLQGIIACLIVLLSISLFFGGKLISQTDAAVQSRGKTLEASELRITNSSGDTVLLLRGNASRGENLGIQVHGGSSVIECFDDAERKTVSIGAATGDIAYKGSLAKVR
ncbi:MAG TPA: hypothetical protein PLD20_22085 [Blastocatellia bacterium]|nr:hypothetical protein [Blastocatellia bacterium]HMV85278.1 hypothetical protein [Blastocatellia bacterium]HMX29379.1 hypothetical protein [Blastocatellia bacterium]HMY72817.1 hypothetical protein [Blastocatellia bacterium]HMZ20643.1 hypothetical protein [Blastocatellia bacterium]